MRSSRSPSSCAISLSVFPLAKRRNSFFSRGLRPKEVLPYIASRLDASSAAAKWLSVPTLRLGTVMIATVAVLMAAHMCEVAIWSLAYAFVGATPEGADRLYFAFVNFTTLGYGDIVPVPRWRLLGPMTAMNGVLLFGWSTAVIFEVMSLTLQRK